MQAGEIPFESVHGAPVFEWFARSENREEAEIFHNAMVSFSNVCLPAFLESYDFSQSHTLVDVGGRLGGIVRTILKACPKLKGVIADLPEVVEPAAKAIFDDGLQARCSAAAQ